MSIDTIETLKAWTIDRAHEWTHTGKEVLILKCVEPDGSSFNGFKWPLKVGATVECPDFDPSNKCSGGLHGWPWGIGIGEGITPKWQGRWIVYSPGSGRIVGNLEGGRKCKTEQGVIRFVGNWTDATRFVLAGQMALVFECSRSATSGQYSTSATSGGYSTSATSGDYSTSATSGYSSTSATSGDYSTSATSGDFSTSATSGDFSKSSATGAASAAVCAGLNSKAKAAAFGCIALGWYNKSADRREMRCAEIGVGDGSDGKLKADVWYQLDESGSFVEVA